MGLRAKVTTAVLAFVLAPILLLGTLTLTAQHEAITHLTRNHLASVAAIQQARITAILSQNRERLALITSRTQLRLNLARHLDTGDPAAAPAMARILDDAARSLPDLLSITVYDLDGRPVASTNPDFAAEAPADPALLARAAAATVADHLALTPTNELRVLLAGPLVLEDRTLGTVLVQARADNLLSSLFDYAGLGRTGESVLAARNGDDGVLFLAPTRFDPDAALRRVVRASDTGADCYRSPSGSSSACTDYRGRRVLAVSRDVPGTDWLVMVKIDRAEALGRLHRTAATGAGLMVVLAALAGTLALRFGRSLSAPLLELGEAAGAVAAGHYDRRVPVRSRDEIGALVRDFNAMAVEIGEAHAALEQRVAELNAALAEIKTLRGIIPICASCKKIRDDQGFWAQIEEYLLDHSEALFSHGLCPDCLKLYEEDGPAGPAKRG